MGLKIEANCVMYMYVLQSEISEEYAIWYLLFVVDYIKKTDQACHFRIWIVEENPLKTLNFSAVK